MAHITIYLDTSLIKTDEERMAFYEGWSDEGGYTEDLATDCPWCCPWHYVKRIRVELPDIQEVPEEYHDDANLSMAYQAGAGYWKAVKDLVNKAIEEEA